MCSWVYGGVGLQEDNLADALVLDSLVHVWQRAPVARSNLQDLACTSRGCIERRPKKGQTPTLHVHLSFNKTVKQSCKANAVIHSPQAKRFALHPFTPPSTPRLAPSIASSMAAKSVHIQTQAEKCFTCLPSSSLERAAWGLDFTHNHW